MIILFSAYGFARRVALDEMAVQSSHKGFVPRAGGLAVYISILGLIPVLTFGFIPSGDCFWSENQRDNIFNSFCRAHIFCRNSRRFGYAMSPKRRLLASAVSSFIVIVTFKVWISNLGLPGIDHLLLFAPFGITFTIFATVGVVNAFNLIDGLNGLAGYITISTAISISYIAFQVGNDQITIFLALISAAVLGFLVLNFPFGKIFLGDREHMFWATYWYGQQFCS